MVYGKLALLEKEAWHYVPGTMLEFSSDGQRRLSVSRKGFMPVHKRPSDGVVHIFIRFKYHVP